MNNTAVTAPVNNNLIDKDELTERKQAIKGLLYIISLITDTQKIVQIKNYAELLYFQGKQNTEEETA